MLPWLSKTGAWQHPLHIIFPQHDMYLLPLPIVGNRRKQMGQSPYSLGGSLNNASSCNSATRLSHCFLCFDRCFFLQAALQYVASLHLLQMFGLIPSLPQLLHTDTAISSFSLFDRSSIFCWDYISDSRSSSLLDTAGIFNNSPVVPLIITLWVYYTYPILKLLNCSFHFKIVPNSYKVRPPQQDYL